MLVESSISQREFNLDDGDAVFTVSVRVTDETGATAPTITVSHPSGQSHGFGEMGLVSGDARDGTYERTVRIPQGSAAGEWEVALYPLDDELGNRGQGFQTLGTVTIIAAPAD
ncbi:hypothetical protein, partial [Georgenia halophila]|uniref:hypothetical protein n=1 Tax=Georgenia halophila TaxID=620889 RepID=UPI0031ECDBA6